MATIVLFMSMSLDGFIAGADDGPDNPFGDDASVLHAWMSIGSSVDPGSHRPLSGPGADVFDEMQTTGAVITGRRTFDIAKQWGGDHHDGVDVFVFTRHVPAEQQWPNVHYVTDIESAVERAKAAAGDRAVLLHGAYTAQQCLRAGLLDELEIAVVPVLLGRGRRLFGDVVPGRVDLELTRVLDAPKATLLRYRVGVTS
jgi:dihydrofolate reductase